MPNIIIPYRITKITYETHNTFTWQVTPQQGDIFDYKPGQFAMLHITSEDGSPYGKKPYSMSSDPIQKNYLEFGVKIHGEFTQKMSTKKEGDIVHIQGPYGIFTYDDQIHTDLVIFGGGIGITPFMSMIRHATHAAPNNILQMFYCNQTPADIAYKQSLDDLHQQNKNFSPVYCVDESKDPEWKGEVGLISEKLIKRYIKILNQYYFMCGPMPFMKAVEVILKNNGITSEKIKREVF